MPPKSIARIRAEHLGRQVKDRAKRRATALWQIPKNVGIFVGTIWLAHKAADFTDPIIRTLTYTNNGAGEVHYTLGVLTADFAARPLIAGVKNVFTAGANLLRSEKRQKPLREIKNPFWGISGTVNYVSTGITLGAAYFIAGPFQSAFENWAREPNHLTHRILSNPDTGAMYMTLGFVSGLIVKFFVDDKLGDRLRKEQEEQDHK